MIWDILSKFVLTLFAFMAIGLAGVGGFFAATVFISNPVVAVIIGIMFGCAMIVGILNSM